MPSLNRATLIGKLGKDPELKYTSIGTAVCNFQIATTTYKKDKEGGKSTELTEWHRIVTWGKVAENCGKYLTKGSAVYIEGELRTRSWEKDGHKNWTTEIVAKSVQFFTPAAPKEESPPVDADPDIPF